MTLPKFLKQPDENTDFSPEVVKYINKLKAEPLVINGLFDILVSGTKDNIDKYIELKVCLSTQSRAIPISKNQWLYMRENNSSLGTKFRYFIYDHKTKKYLFCECNELKNGLQNKEPKSTSYIRQKHLKKLNWLLPEIAYSNLNDWLNGYNKPTSLTNLNDAPSN